MDAKRWQWLVKHTGEDTTRGIAKACGVTHPTIGRWLSKGIPMDRLTELMFKFQADPIEACVAWGYLRAEHVEQLNWAAFVQYVPMAVLVDEVHRREKPAVRGWADPLRRRVPPDEVPLKLA